MFEVHNPIFAYLDEENDTITVATQAEYKGALDFAAGKPLRMLVHVNDSELRESLIPAQLERPLMMSSLPSAFNLKNSGFIRPSQAQAQAQAPRTPVALDEEFKQSIREALREELSSMIIKPRPTSTEVFNHFCSICNRGPILKLIYLCVNCPYMQLCEACEENFDHEHALVKVKNESMMKQVTAHTQKMLANGRV